MAHIWWQLLELAEQQQRTRMLSDVTASAGSVTASASGQATKATSTLSLKWKMALWEKNSIEPAMLRVPIVMIVFLFLWAANVWLFERARLQYYGVLSIKTVPLTFSLVTASVLATTYAVNMTLFSNMLGMSVETGVCLFYILLLIVNFLPSIGLPGQETKNSFLRLVRLVFFPSTSISFPEVLLADAFTSLSKVFKDIGVTAIAIYAQMSGTNIVTMHDEGMLLVAVLASLPYWLRIRQCWIQLDGTSDMMAKVPITLNLIKYFSAFPPIWLAAAASLGYFHPDLPTITAAMATINSLYSYLWDVCMDWGIFSFTRDGRCFLRQRMLLPMWFYALAAVVNLLLRFSWAANRVSFFSHLHASHLVLMVELAEVFRRAMWNVLRVEWEILVQEERSRKALGGSGGSGMVGGGIVEEAKLLGGDFPRIAKQGSSSKLGVIEK